MEFNPNIIETINRLSDVVKEEETYINKIVEQTYKKLLIEKSKKEIVLDLKQFNEQDEVIKNRVILYTVKLINGSTQGVEKIHIRDIVKLCNNNIGNKYLTPNKNLKILIKNKKIFFISQIV